MNSTYSPFFFVFSLRNMIDQATIDRILDAAQIVDVVSEFVTLRKRGVNYIGLCPFHNEKTPSFSVSPSKGLCKCFSCGKGGNVVHFIMEHEQLSYYEALKWLANKYHIEVKERELTDEEKQAHSLRESLFVVNQFASEYFQDILYNHIDGQRIGMTYLRSRGFRDDIIKKFQLGYSTDSHDALARTAKQKGYQEEFLVKTGLCYRKDDGSLRDRFWGRVIFPVHTLSGKVVAFGGRVLSAATKNVQMKYVNSPESEIYHKSRELYGIYFAKQAIVRQDRCFLVEGYTDVISMHQSGIENVVASSGTALTSDQIRLIHRFTNNITVLYDGDGAGIKASIRGIDMLLEEGMNIKVCLLPDGDDPDSFARKHNATDYQAYINEHEVDFIRFKTNLLMEEAGKDPIKRASLISSIVKSISVIPDSIVRSVYTRECSQLLQMEEKILIEAMIDQATIDRILDAAQIVDVVSEFVTLRKRGVNYIGLCPFHNEKTPSFSVSPSKGLCKCFSCGKGGNVVHFIMEHEQLSYYEALKWLANKYHIEVKERELTDEEKQAHSLRESLFVVNQFASEYFQDILYNHIDGQRIGMTYLRSRGFRDDIIKKFQLGYSTDSHDALARTAKQKGYQEEFLVKTGLCYRKDDGSLRDRFWGRVIFPVHTLSGKVVAFGGRVLSAATKNVQMKYVNSPESEIYHKSRELYGIYFAKQAIVRQDRCFLVEGYTDVISMHQSGIENVVASSGTALTSDQIRLIHRFTNNITVLYDGDGAGIKASIRGIDMLLEEGMNIKVCLLPDGDDPDSFARKHNATDYQAYINEHEVDFIRFKTNLLMEEAGKDPIKRASLISSIVKSISVIPDSIVRSVYTRECSQLLQMEEKILIEAVNKLIEQAQENKYKEIQRKQRQATQDVQPAPPTTYPETQPTEIPIPDETQLPPAPLETDAEYIPPTAEQPAGQPTSTPAPTDNYLSYIPLEGNEQKLFYKKEQLLLQMIVRYGEKVMCYLEDENGEEQPLTVIECISSSLKEDELQFHYPLDRRILKEAENHLHDEGFVSERYFLTHPDPEISKQAAELASDRYQLSKYHSKGQAIITDEERLYELVPRLLIDFKLSIVEEEMKHTLQALTNPDIYNNPEKCQEIMQHYKELQEIQIPMAQKAGDRVILR